MRKLRTGLVPVRASSLMLGVAASLVAAPIVLPAPVHAADWSVPRGQEVDDFYKVRSGRPLWFQAGQPTAAAHALLSLLTTARADGLDPGRYKVDEIREALKRASNGDQRAVRKADMLLSSRFAAYARDLKAFPTAGLAYADPALRLGPPSPLRLLQMAEKAPSLTQFVADMGWMNPAYASLRRAFISGSFENDRQRELLRINLERARVLPASDRYIIVNVASQRLYMYEGTRLADTMKVVVGQDRAERKTPMMAGYLRYASLNPYWNVPPDLVWDDVGKYVEEFGLGYLKSRGHQVLSDWGDNPSVVDPSTVDWDAVRAGTVQIRVRQLPGPQNFLGKVKYAFTNPFGVYLHDTPKKELLKEQTRLFSGGCIRLEDADRLGRWLFGKTLVAQSDEPDIEVALDKPVPVFVTYMTAEPSGTSITYFDDVYGWDAERLAELGFGGKHVAAR
ncbi:MAG TPA: L,D-transpeptidase family protein [Sphingomicrobium sp.]|nr:L,D-transpeptidase family protein [Sphingomicrobium sp.]